MGRAPCCEKVGLNKGRWTAEEDDLLKNYILTHGEGSWRSLPKNAGLLRCGKSCRLRWINYLRTDVKRGNITPQEQDLIVKLHSTFGNKWSLIASQLEGRTDNEIKNYWNSHLSRKIHYFRKQWRASDPGNTTTLSMTTTAELQPQPPRRQGRGRTSRANMKKTKQLRSPSAIITKEEGNNTMNINNGANNGHDHDQTVMGPGGEEAVIVEDHRHLMCFDDDTMMDLTTLLSTKENSTSVDQPEISCSNAGESNNEQAWMSACDSINTSNGCETQQDQLLSWLMWDTDGGCGFQEAQCEPKEQEDAMLAWLLS